MLKKKLQAIISTLSVEIPLQYVSVTCRSDVGASGFYVADDASGTNAVLYEETTENILVGKYVKISPTWPVIENYITYNDGTPTGTALIETYFILTSNMTEVYVLARE